MCLLIDGLGHFTYSWSATRWLRVGNGLATLLDNMRESIHAPLCNLWCLQVRQSQPSASRCKPVLICIILARSLGFHAVTPERSIFPTFIRRWIRGIVCGAIDCSWNEIASGETDMRTKCYCTEYEGDNFLNCCWLATYKILYCRKQAICESVLSKIVLVE